MSISPPFGVFSSRNSFVRPSDRRPAAVPRGLAGGGGGPGNVAGPSFEDVYRGTFPLVWRLLRRLGIPEPDQPDVAQETFLRAAEELNTRDTSVDLVAWICQITNHAATRHRRLSRNYRELLANEENLAGCVGDTCLAEGIARRERWRLVDHLVQSIEDGRERLVVVMHDLEEMTIADITRALGIPRRTARDHLEMGRERFRAAVNALHPDDREVLGVRRSGVFPFFVLDLARIAEAERPFDERAAEVQERIWGLLQERMLPGTGGGRAPRGAVRRALGRLPYSAAQALGAVLVVVLVGAVVGLFARPRLPALESEAPVRITPDDVVSTGPTTTPPADGTGATTTPAGSTSSAMVASWSGAAPRSSAVKAGRGLNTAASITSAGRDLSREDKTLINRARAHLGHRAPRPDLALVNLRLHAQRYPNSTRARDREALLALVLAAQSNQAAAAGATTPKSGDGP
jgi:RNA polymerase sigma-70 factor, ECF subfamily